MYKDKYLKYKNKYLNLKKIQYGGECNPIHKDRNYNDLFTNKNIYESHFIPEMRIMLRGRCYLVTSLYDYHIKNKELKLMTKELTLMTNEQPNITELELGEIKNKYTIAIGKVFENIKAIPQDSDFYKDIKRRFKELMPYKFISINDQNAVVINNNLYLLFDGTIINSDQEVYFEQNEVLTLDIGAIVIIKKFNKLLIGIIIRVLENETFEVLIFHPSLLRNKDVFIKQESMKLKIDDIELL